MALRIWLPLINNVRNSGIDKVKATNNGAVLNTGGVYGNCYHFGTASSYITLPPSCMTGFTTACTVSFWLRITTWNTTWATFFQAGTGTNAWAGYIFGFLRNSSNSNICFTIGNGSTTSTTSYATPTMSLNTWYHVVLSYETGLCKIYLNGTLSNQYTTTIVPNFAAITKITLGTSNVVSQYQTDCDINDFRIYDHALTKDDVLRIYQNKSIFEIPFEKYVEKPTYPLWIKLLHHNAPSSNLFTASNYKKNNQYNLYSKCGIMFGNTIFKLNNDKYEFLAKEKLESGSTEDTFRWTQTSSPTASTISGFSSITNTCGTSRMIGLLNNGTYAAFHNGSSWWCACGSYSEFNGGIPGFRDVIKTGYLDLFVRAEIRRIPNDYEELDYIEGTGTQWIDTGYLVNSSNILKLKYKLDAMPTDTAVGNKWWACGIGGASGIGFHVGLGNGNTSTFPFTFARGISDYTTSVNGSLNTRYKWELDMENTLYKVWSNEGVLLVSQTFTAQTPTQQQTLPLFRWRSYSNSGYIFGMRIYRMQLFNDSAIIIDMIPARRIKDGVIGMYDVVRKKFYTNAGSGTFVTGPTHYVSKDYIPLEYIKSTGTQYVNTTYVPKANTKMVLKFKQEQAQTAATYYAISCLTADDGHLLLECFIQQTNKWAYSVGGTQYLKTLDFPATDMLEVEMSLTKFAINGSIIQTASTKTITNTRELYLFAYTDGSHNVNNRCMSCNLYSAKIYETNNGIDTLIKDLVPAKRRSDNAVGLYDIVSGQFLTNAGTGTFTGA